MTLLKVMDHSTFLGPIHLRESITRNTLSTFVAQHNGYVPTRLLTVLYDRRPWLKLAVGNLRDFCASCACLQYVPRTIDAESALQALPLDGTPLFSSEV